MIFEQELVDACAKAIEVYYAAEAAFVKRPTQETLHAYFIACSRFHVLRDELGRANRLGDAFSGTPGEHNRP